MKCLKDGFAYKVGAGNISLWFNKFLNEGYLRELVDYVNIQDSYLHLKDIYIEGNWNWTLATMIPMEVRRKITSLYLNQDIVDEIIWSVELNGIYTTKFTYLWLIA